MFNGSRCHNKRKSFLRKKKQNTPNQNKMSMETHLPQPPLPSLFPRGGPAALLTLPFRRHAENQKKTKQRKGTKSWTKHAKPKQNVGGNMSPADHTPLAFPERWPHARLLLDQSPPPTNEPQVLKRTRRESKF